MPEQLRVMISTTARDLPEHRKEVLEACLRQGMFPIMMEHLPAIDAEALSVSLALVDEADIYIGVFAHRYGYIPKASNPHAISLTEMEYNRAVERKIERLIFIMDKSHPITVDDVEIENATKLKAFKERVGVENIVRFFKSPGDLRVEVIKSLSHLRQPDLTNFHYISDIPAPPEEYVAHPYTLLQTHRLIGRTTEIALLTDWVSKRQDEVFYSRIMNIIAIGGMGKSALTWKWFNDIAPHEMKPLAGRMWWSFYESDATFENFVVRALAYVTRRSLAEMQEIPPPERETQLLAALDREPFLFVLDGLERILIAYARMDAARLDYREVGRENSLRKTADPRAGQFLRKLAKVKQSRILISSRLYPSELETGTGEPIPGSFKCDITGLTDHDAVELWRAFGVSGSRDELLPIFATFAKHPLLIQALAGEVKRYRSAPGNLTAWLKANPQFDTRKFPKLKDSMAHTLDFALRGLDDRARKVLNTIAAFRMPTGYDTLAAILTGEDKACANERELDEDLTELEDRGLLGWDKRANRYDLHPIVRGVVWSELGNETRRGLYQTLHSQFESLPGVRNRGLVSSIEELTPAIELYSTLIGLERYDEAELLFYDRISRPVFYLGASRQQSELLEMLFPDGVDRLPRVSRLDMQAFALNALALAYDASGNLGRTAPLYRRQITLQEQAGNLNAVGIAYCNMSNALQMSGAIHEAESAACRSLLITRDVTDRISEAISLYAWGTTLAVRGLMPESGYSLGRALQMRCSEGDSQAEGIINSQCAQRLLWLGDYGGAFPLANRAWELANIQRIERDFIRAARVQGEAAVGLNDFTTADERLHHALTRARTVNLVEEELPALVALAELRRRQGDARTARELLDDVWESAERGPYPLFHADAFNVLAQIERDEGNTAAAIEAATKAYRLAWCDGPPFAYHWGLEKAKQHLKELGAPEPEMPPFDESKFEPMPEVEINPHDEFYVDEGSIN